MNGLPPLGNLRRTLSTRVMRVRESRFFHDRLSLGFIVAALAINVLTFVTLVPSVHPTTERVPVHFSSLDLGYGLGGWYVPYGIALFALVVTVANATLAFQAFTRSRLSSFFLLIGAGVVSVFALVIANALGVVR